MAAVNRCATQNPRRRPLGRLFVDIGLWVAEEIPAKVAADKAYQNPQKHSDRQNARIEHDKALQRVIIELLTDHTELFKQFMLPSAGNQDPNVAHAGK